MAGTSQAGWRGPPELVRTERGPLYIEIDSTYEDLAALAGSGSYVLQVVDGDGLLLRDVPTMRYIHDRRELGSVVDALPRLGI